MRLETIQPHSRSLTQVGAKRKIADRMVRHGRQGVTTEDMRYNLQIPRAKNNGFQNRTHQLHKSRLLIVVFLMNAPLWAQAQSSTAVRAASKFEVASVKPTNPDQRGLSQLNCSGGTGFIARDQTLLVLVEWAYDLPFGAHRVLGGPKWMSSPETTFDLRGKVERKVSFDECRLMAQSLLADRFKVALHWESKELPVYVLSIGKGGSKLHRADDDPKVLSRVTLNGAQIQLADGYSTTGSGRGMSMRELSRFLARLPTVGRPVIDKTGIEGLYGFSLEFAMKLGDESRPDIFAALQEQLGLRLDSAKEPVQLLVIDHAEKPSEN